MAGRWLLKTEPEEWSWEHQQANGGVSHWDGVRNALAQKHLRAMELGDLCLFYHSGNKAKEIVGIARVCKLFYPDSSDASGKHGMVDIEAVSKLLQPLPLSRLKQEDGLHSFIMFRQPRLSVVPVSTPEWNLICELAGQLEPPLLLDVNGEYRVSTNDQSLESDNGEARAMDISRMPRESKPSSPHQDFNVRVRVRARAREQIAKHDDDETRDPPPDISGVPSQSSSEVRKQPRKQRTKIHATKKVSEMIPPSEVPQPIVVESSIVMPTKLSREDATEDGDIRAPSDSVVRNTIKFVPDSKRVYIRRSRKQGEVEPLPMDAEANDSTGNAFADVGRVYRRRNR